MGRRELKYLIDEATADRVRCDIAGFCATDANAPNGRYSCDTLYLDTFRFDLYRATVENQRIRHKLRVRTYPQTPGSPVFLEVKKRVDDVIVKARTPLAPATWSDIVEAGDLERVPPAHRHDAEHFFAGYHGGHNGPLLPQVMVRYEREPYTSQVDDEVRVTFDRKIEARPCSSLTFEDTGNWSPIDHPLAMRASLPGSLVVLELKFTGAAPAWMQRLVRRRELRRLSFSKYARAVETIARAPQLRRARWA